MPDETRLTEADPPPARARRARGGDAAGATLAIAGSLAFISITPLVYDSWRAAPLLLAAAAGGAWTYRRRARLVAAYFVACMAVLLLVAFTPVSRLVANGLTRRDPQPRSVDAIIALSSSISSDGHLGPDSIDRLLHALALARVGLATTLIVTRPRLPAGRSPTLVADQQRIIALLPSGLRTLAIDDVTSTRSEATGAALLGRAHGLRSLAVVTSPLHSHRACAVFESAGFRVVCLPAESRSIAFGEGATARDRIRAFRSALYERLAALQYRARGWM